MSLFRKKQVRVPIVETVTLTPQPTQKRRGKARTIEDEPMVESHNTLSLTHQTLPADPVELVQLYRECKPHYDDALRVASDIGATMNAIADILEHEHEITVPRVGAAQADPAAARREQARRLAAGLGETNGTAPKAHATGQALLPSVPVAQFKAWSAQPEQTGDPNSPPPVPAGYDPDAWREEWRQANTPTPSDVLRSAGVYVPGQRIDLKSKDNPAPPDSTVAEVRAEGAAGPEFGFQQTAIARFSQIAAAGIATAPQITRQLA